jgi:transcriptional regulator GlxA family with amidase domain
MSFAALPVFEYANKDVGEPVYDLYLLSETGGLMRSSIGVSVVTEPFRATVFDTLFFCRGTEPPTPDLIEFLRQAPERCRRVAATCTSAFILAEAGLLDGRRATTHWSRARDLQARFPKVKVEEGPHLHCRRPGMDLGRDDLRDRPGAGHGRTGSRRGRRPSRRPPEMVVYHRRAGGQSQFSALLELEPKSDRIQSALAYAKRNLDKPLTVGRLAEAAHLSPRQFSRAFRAATGHSPAKALENLRIEAARLMIEQSRHPIDVIARQTGFADRARMRRAFLRAFGQPPQVIRRNARAEAVA